jgi:pimeloyl-ACP methyl ester carboxylesterase
MTKFVVQKKGGNWMIALNIFVFLLLPGWTSAQQNSGSQNNVALNTILEEKFVLINGIKQWVTIKGNRSRPVVLFLHGGPGSPLSPYADHLYKNWQTDFIIVQWDQRGSGKTYGEAAPDELTPEYLQANPLTLEQMVNDGIVLTEYLLKHLGKTKVILFGTSWGSLLGVKMVSQRPDLFYAYVGHSQIVNPAIDQTFYDKLFKMAELKRDSGAIATLKTLGPPPYDRARTVGQLLRIVKKFENADAATAPEHWFEPSPAYDNKKDEQLRSDGDDYSFVNYAGDTKLGVKAISATIDLERDNLVFKVPVYIIQGESDILTPKEKTKAYFDKIEAPEKKYYLVPKAAHGFNTAILEQQYKVIKSIKIEK